MKVFSWPLLAVLYFSVATVLAETAALGMLWLKGGLSKDRIAQLLAVAHDVDLPAMRRRLEVAAQPIRQESPSYDEVRQARHVAALDLTLREIATDKGLAEIRRLSEQFDQEWKTYKKLKEDFDKQLEKLHQGASDQAVQDVQRQLESIHAKLAKDQLLRILDNPEVDPDKAMNFVVTVFRGMPLDKRKKVIAEFKNADSERLHEILSHVRRGEPAVGLFRETQQQLKRFD